MEGKSSACAHSSPLGNVSGACADLWSNESVQNIKLLAGMAPSVYMEHLEYDTRLMNAALRAGKEDALKLRSFMVYSDVRLDPQAFILAPENVIKVSQAIVDSDNHVQATRNACLVGLDLIDRAYRDGKVMISDMELPWLESLKSELKSIPDTEEQFIQEMLPYLDREKLDLTGYGIE